MQNASLIQKNNSFSHAIALSGGIATGKSTTSSLFMLHGFLTIDADSIAHKLLDLHSSTIALMFGDQYVHNGKVLRKELGKIIFNNEDQKLKLESFIHPLIKDEIINQAHLFEKNKKPYLIDIPLFFEKGNYDIQKSIVVYTPKEVQIQRLINRDKCSTQEALKKISNQMDIEKKKELATYVIDNSKDLKNLQNEVERVKSLVLN